MTRTRRPARHTTSTLKKRCTDLRTELREHPANLATPEELTAYWPGGAENPERGLSGWIECYAQFIRLVGRLERLESHAATPELDERLRTVIAEAQRAQPESVTLSDGTTRAVYPKGIWALSYLEAFGYVSAGALTALLAVIASGADVEQLVELPLTKTKAIRAWAWVLCTAGASVPWPDGASDLELPQWTAELTPQDLIALDAAHRKIHGERMAIMAHLFPPEPGAKSRLAIGGMLAAYQFDRGLTQDAMRLLSVGEVTAGACATAEMHRVAKENADAKRERA